MAKRRNNIRQAADPRHFVPLQRARIVRGTFDNAQTTDNNRKHWATASLDYSADALATPAVRRALRARCRYECRNNSWAKGIKDTLANDCIGTGPRLQLVTAEQEFNDLVEAEFRDWAAEINLAEKLRVMRAARVESGEAFGLMATNPSLVHDVKLDLQIIEPEQVTTPYLADNTATLYDGIELDQYGNPSLYWILKVHPGAATAYPASLLGPESFNRWPARYVLHYRRIDRPGQIRGLPDLTPAIDQFAELRRYSKAVILAAEIVADHALVIYTDGPADPDSAANDELTDFSTVELARGMATALPAGYKLGQPQAEQPTTTYPEFVKSKLGEIARCLGVPRFIAGLDAADANMSSAYVVGQKYATTVGVDRADLEVLLNRLLDAWLNEWLKIRRPAAVPDRVARTWQWDAIGNHADPTKVAAAQATRLAAGVTSIPREYAAEGLDWEDEQEAAAKALGLTLDEYRAAIRQKLFGGGQAQQQPQPPQKQGADAPDAGDDSELEE